MPYRTTKRNDVIVHRQPSSNLQTGKRRKPRSIPAIQNKLSYGKARDCAIAVNVHRDVDGSHVAFFIQSYVVLVQGEINTVRWSVIIITYIVQASSYKTDIAFDVDVCPTCAFGRLVHMSIVGRYPHISHKGWVWYKIMLRRNNVPKYNHIW